MSSLESMLDDEVICDIKYHAEIAQQSYNDEPKYPGVRWELHNHSELCDIYEENN
jgi:hypothetical protein